MAFSVTNRVRVSDQHSEHRNLLGTVMAVTDDNHDVRLDGFPKTGKTVLLLTNQLQTTTQPVPVDYGE